MHALMMSLLPGWRVAQENLPKPLTVEIIKPPEIEPPKPLPLTPEPPPRIKPKPEPVKETKRTEPAPQPKAAPILTAPPDAQPAPQAPVVPPQPPVQDSKPTPPPPEPPRAQAPPPAAVTPPRSDAAYLNNPRPNYPLAAQRRGDQGTVLLRVLVTAEGRASSVSLEKSSGHSSLDESALTAVRSWRFVPAKQGTQAVDAPYVVPVVFKLD